MRYLIAALGIVAAALFGAPEAIAGPDMSCQEALDWQASHNAAGDFVDTTSQSAVDAYNSEADAIDAALWDACG